VHTRARDRLVDAAGEQAGGGEVLAQLLGLVGHLGAGVAADALDAEGRITSMADLLSA
jgi:hypothetical protein